MRKGAPLTGVTSNAAPVPGSATATTLVPPAATGVAPVMSFTVAASNTYCAAMPLGAKNTQVRRAPSLSSAINWAVAYFNFAPSMARLKGSTAMAFEARSMPRASSGMVIVSSLSFSSMRTPLRSGSFNLSW